MKAMIAAFIAILVIAFGAEQILDRIGVSSGTQSAGDAVRIGDPDRP